MNKVLVTGSSGFIGSRLVDCLLDAQYEVHDLDVNRPSNQGQQLHFHEESLLNEGEMLSIISSITPDLIVHLAARIDLTETKGLDGYSSNIQGVQNLVNAIKSCPNVKRTIFTSSQLVCRVGYIPKHDEDYAPSTLYGQSKVLTEKIVRNEDGAGREWCVTRPTTIWGPGVSPHYQRVLSMIQKGTYFHVGNRPLYKSYGYVDNTAYQYKRLLEAPVDQFHRQTFYLADYQPTSLRAWINAFQREFGAPPVRTYPEGLVRSAARVGDLLNWCGLKNLPFNSFRIGNILTEYQFDLANTQAVCGPLPYTMEEGVKFTVQWMLDK